MITLKSAVYTILVVCCMKRKYRRRKEVFDNLEDSENRTRKKASEGRMVRTLMNLPKQDPLSWIAIQSSKAGAKQNKFNESNNGLLHPGLK